MKKWKTYALVLLILICFAVWIEFRLNTPKLLEMTEDVKAEFNTIQQMPESEIIKFKATRKTDNAYVDAYFKVDASYEDIKNYYMNELEKIGWTYESENIVKEWGKETNGRTLDFSKNPYKLEIFYVGDMDSSYAYGISISFQGD